MKAGQIKINTSHKNLRKLHLIVVVSITDWTSSFAITTVLFSVSVIKICFSGYYNAASALASRFNGFNYFTPT